MYLLVNESPHKVKNKTFDVATSNFADTLVRSKAGICEGVTSTKVWLYLDLTLFNGIKLQTL